MAVRWLVGGGNGNWNSTTNWSATNGGGAGASFPVAGDTANLNSAANIAINVGSACAVLDCTGYSGTLSGGGAMTTTGNVTGGGTWTQTGQWNFNGTGVQVITMNGKAFGGGVQQNGVGGTVRLADAFQAAVNYTLTNGTLDCATFNPTVRVRNFALGVGTKSLQQGNSQWTLTMSVAGQGWDTTTNALNFTKTTGGASKLTFTGGAGVQVNMFCGASQTFDDVAVTGGTGLFFLSANNGFFRDILVSNAAGGAFTLANGTYRNLDFTGFTSTLNQTLGWSVTGNITLVSTMTVNSTSSISMRGTTGTQNVTTAGVSVTFELDVFNASGTGNVVNLLDAYSSTRRVRLRDNGAGIVAKAGTTNTCSLFDAVGIVGNLCPFKSDTPGSPTTWSIAQGDQRCTGLDVTDVHVTGGGRWWAGRIANDNGGNAGWRFTDWALRGLARFVA